MSEELLQKFASRLAEIIAGRPIKNIPNGPSQSYIYRLLKGVGNPTIDNLQMILKHYGSDLATFFEPWGEEVQTGKAAQVAEARQLFEEVIRDGRFLPSLLPVLKLYAQESKRTPRRH